MTTSYDSIARFYDVDMAKNMPFDDVAFYRQSSAASDGPVLELGCGNGRILLPLLASGLDAWGVDGSTEMLAHLHEKARRQGLRARALPMDIRRLALPQRFATILCPYSLVTYFTDDAEVSALLRSIRAHLRAGGRLVIDAFVPGPVQFFSDFRLDYRRPFGTGTLVRWKRIHRAGPNTNRIERRYQVIDSEGNILDQVDVDETIRPFAPDELRRLVRAAGLQIENEFWDYGAGAEGAAQFFTLSATSEAGPSTAQAAGTGLETTPSR